MQYHAIGVLEPGTAHNTFHQGDPRVSLEVNPFEVFLFVQVKNLALDLGLGDPDTAQVSQIQRSLIWEGRKDWYWKPFMSSPERYSSKFKAIKPARC